MSKLKNMPGVAWLVIGVCVTALVMPTAAFAAGALRFTGIEGTSTSKADVSPAGQVLTAPAYPSKYFADADASLSGTYKPVATPPSGDGLVVTSINVSVYSVSSPGPSSYINFDIEPSGCPNSFVGPFQHAIYPSTIGSTELTFDPGVVIPSGDSLCGYTSGPGAYAEATGYTAPAADV